MKAVEAYPAHVRQACASGAQAIVMGAGLPLDLPELTEGYPDVALIPILSDARGVAVVLKKWARKERLPDAIVIEHPRVRGRPSRRAQPGRSRRCHDSISPKCCPACSRYSTTWASQRERIPVIVGGGINSHEKLLAALALGASAVQIGTPFAVTEEGDAHPNFKRVLAEAKPEDIVTFMSVAGLPARAVKTPWLSNYLQARAQAAGVRQGRPASAARSACTA